MRSPLLSPARVRAARLGAAALAGVLALAGCAAGSPGGSGSSAPGAVSVVASTNVYGDLAKAVGGDKVAVTSLVAKSSQDPHSYEATSQDRLAVSKAGLVIENGGGYDPFLSTLVREGKVPDGSVITAVQVAGVAEGGNEHVWYDLGAMGKVTAAIADRLSALDPAGKEAFQSNAKGVEERLSALEARAAALAPHTAGKKALVTEPVPLYLLQAAGLANATPQAFTSAVEEGQDAPPAAFKETLDLVTSKSVALLAYNPQTEGAQTEQLRKAAQSAGLPVVDFTETVPAGMDYLGWMQSNVDALAKAVS